MTETKAQAGRRAAVFVAGSWGTALASVLAQNGFDVLLWTRNADQAEQINTKHENSKYLPGVKLPQSLRATTEMKEALQNAELALFVAPSAAMREVAKQAAPFMKETTLCIHATKGFETGTLKRMTTVLAEELGRSPDQIAVLSGPSHAEEVIRKQPTTVVVASADLEAAEQAQDAFMNAYFRVYTNPDVAGVEVAGAIKNIIALGAGLSDGLGFGDNAKAALITRGLAEISRLGTAMGANPLTFAGLAGVGDLVVTCTSKHSRNWRAGSMLADGSPLDDVLERMGMVVEGVKTTRAAYELASRYDVEMPITAQLYQVLFAGSSPRTAVENLMGRLKTHEIEQIE
ncbi:NAD(P)H-dependent glycerol-3-phosphate dehydrogenase [Paenibacillus radicis (ex Gao et al. 2016)]|uniref:Glycerol-3-phosphate dehydrogenase [NAD(P)+] n=1 Tax=Paenibacillus radicis (ex Gao et al. 2016) TaxID=1737354 RepID=A0A917GV20_9BACL|nr:NAD(P)H-dependent glycerol-3-phosphate dehydrogenase [Paenibacillus radicis (ex Gao et al. 2016)]GGG57510.1 glycerol-3-phosphate dehydrogenase [NAD(P)+] [Paenibacillus radicis (ex Gao et al. 2016)]